MNAGEPVTVLMVDDDEADVALTLAALEETKLVNEFVTVRDGHECLQFLDQASGFEDAPRPDLILLDINMPKMGGLETLQAIRAQSRFATIPIVMLTTSDDEGDVLKSYKLEANCYVTKPVDLTAFMKAIHSIEEFWLAVVRLPPKER